MFHSDQRLRQSEIKYGINPSIDFELCNVASSTDMTGLIPSAPISSSEIKHYGDLIEYQAQDITIPNVKTHAKR